VVVVEFVANNDLKQIISYKFLVLIIVVGCNMFGMIVNIDLELEKYFFLVYNY
jgi:hypothetical protein